MMDDRLDQAIDSAVREMMDREPRPGLSQRVRARLEGTPQASTRVMPWLLATGAFAAAAIALLLGGRVWLPWQHPHVPDVTIARTPSTQQPSERLARAPGAPENAVNGRPVRRGGDWSPIAAPRGGRVATATSTDLGSGLEIAPLAVPEPLDVAPIPEQRTQTNDITLPALPAIAPLELERLSSPR